jgi:hypothetical protein
MCLKYAKNGLWNINQTFLDWNTEYYQLAAVSCRIVYCETRYYYFQNASKIYLSTGVPSLPTSLSCESIVARQLVVLIHFCSIKSYYYSVPDCIVYARSDHVCIAIVLWSGLPMVRHCRRESWIVRSSGWMHAITIELRSFPNFVIFWIFPNFS